MNKPEKLIIVIFGASGDLTWRKLIPALYDLFVQDLLPEEFKIVGVGRTSLSDVDFRQRMIEGLEQFTSTDFFDSQKVLSFSEQLFYHCMDTKKPKDYFKLKEHLEYLANIMTCQANYLYYFALPPNMIETVANSLKDSGLTCQEKGWKRVIVEKPFGKNLASAKKLNQELLHSFSEDQIYRIDHYLGKETVQNILITRFSNSVFEPLWNRNYIERIEITSSESLGVGSRAGYYESAGALRDMLQNHLLQILGIVAMEPPVNSDANAIRNEMLKVFQSLRRISEQDVPQYVVRGQYTESKINQSQVKSYRDEKGVDPHSSTETYVAMKCLVDNWRWSGVPFYIRTGKCLPTRVTEVAIHFKPNPHKIFFHENPLPNSNNQLIIRIQPDEGLLLKFGMKIPGAGFRVEQVNMDFHYSSLNHTHIPEAYERLLHDCMLGDATLYQRGDAVEETWSYVQPILDAWEHNSKIPLYGYPAGSWGPEQADRLLEQDGFQWRYPCKNLVNDGLYCEL